MEAVRMNIKAICAVKGWNMEKLSSETGISLNHLRYVSSGRSKLNVNDIIRLHKATGVPIENIVYAYVEEAEEDI